MQSAVNLIARGSTERLARFIGLFINERFLDDYADDAKLLWRLNMVMNRVKLSQLPESLIDVLAEARKFVRNRAAELLPREHYAMDV